MTINSSVTNLLNTASVSAHFKLVYIQLVRLTESVHSMPFTHMPEMWRCEAEQIVLIITCPCSVCWNGVVFTSLVHGCLYNKTVYGLLPHWMANEVCVFQVEKSLLKFN